MIDEILINLFLDKNEELRYLKVAAAHPKLSEALTAIYEIGLEVIGQDEPLEGLTGTVRTAYNNKNFLRASQRKAWAKACGVEDVS